MEDAGVGHFHKTGLIAKRPDYFTRIRVHRLSLQLRNHVARNAHRVAFAALITGESHQSAVLCKGDIGGCC